MNQLRELIHGGDLPTALTAHPGLDFLDFSANINPLGLPAGVRDTLEQSGAHCEHYPDALCRELRAAVGAFEDVPSGWVLCGNGASDLIYRIPYALRPQRALLPAPTFAEYEHALRQTDCASSYYTLYDGDCFAFREDILEAVPECGIVFLCNPNNPTGQLIKPDLMHRVVKVCGSRNTLLVVDECFLDFVENGEAHSVKPLLAENRHLVVLRAFTKQFAMPGIRLGYALCADPELLGRIERAGAPWSVSVPAQLCGITACGETEYLQRSREFIQREKSCLAVRLQNLGLRVFQPAANYILFHTPRTDLAERMCARGVLIRDCSNYRGLSPGYYRVAVRTRPENDRLVQVLEACIG